MNKKYNRELLAEEKIEGREITVPILNGKALPIVEIVPISKVYDYDSKYVAGKTNYIVPAPMDKMSYSKICKMSEQIYLEMGCRHYSRIDYILCPDNKPYFLELNTYPGMTDTSLFPKSAKSSGISFQELMVKLVCLAKNE